MSSIRAQPGVDAVILLGRDGLVIDGESPPALDPHELAARTRTFLDGSDSLMRLDTESRPEGAGGMVTAVLEYPGRYGVVSVLSSEAMLLVLADKGAKDELGPLLYQLRARRDEIAALL